MTDLGAEARKDALAALQRLKGHVRDIEGFLGARGTEEAFENARRSVADANNMLHVILSYVDLLRVANPSEIAIGATGACGDTLGNAEAEQAAALLVQYCVEHGDRWQEPTVEQLIDWCKGSPLVRRWAQNPFWRPSPQRVQEQFGAEFPMKPRPRLIFLLSHPGAWRRGTER